MNIGGKFKFEFRGGTREFWEFWLGVNLVWDLIWANFGCQDPEFSMGKMEKVRFPILNRRKKRKGTPFAAFCQFSMGKWQIWGFWEIWLVGNDSPKVG